MSWPKIALGEAFEFIRNGMSVKQSKDAGGLPITRIETISDGTVDFSRVGFAGLSEADVEKWLLQDGDILLSHINSVEHIGKCALFEGVHKPLVHGMNLLAMRPNTEILFPRYAMWALKAPDFKASILRFVNKAVNQASISTTNLKTVEIPLPPLEEQKRIAGILDQADALRRLRARALDKLNTLGQAIFHEMFALVSEETGCLGDLVEVNSGNGFPDKYQGEEDGEFPFFKVGDMNLPGNETYMRQSRNWISEEVRQEIRAKVFPAGSIIFPKIGAAIATNKKRILIQPSCLDNNVMALIPNGRASTEYLHTLLLGRNLMDIAQPGNPPSIRKGSVENWAVSLPAVARDKEFQRRLDVLRHQIEQAALSSTTLHRLFEALQHRAFRGEL